MEQNIENNNEIILTKEGKEELIQELNQLINVTRPSVIKQLKEARELGDLSENAEYNVARDLQAEVEAKIKELETTLARAKVINTTHKNDKIVKLGANVVLLNLDTNKETTIKIVGTIEANPFESKISNETPLVKAILNRQVNDIVEVKSSKNKYKVKIVKILK